MVNADVSDQTPTRNCDSCFFSVSSFQAKHSILSQHNCTLGYFGLSEGISRLKFFSDNRPGRLRQSVFAQMYALNMLRDASKYSILHCSTDQLQPIGINPTVYQLHSHSCRCKVRTSLEVIFASMLIVLNEMPLSFDYSRGSAFVDNEHLYYSPNCLRPVIIPPRGALVESASPFRRRQLQFSEFSQPVWWSQSWSWLSFVPLQPTYTSFPFEPLTWCHPLSPYRSLFSIPRATKKSKKCSRCEMMLLSRGSSEKSFCPLQQTKFVSSTVFSAAHHPCHHRLGSREPIGPMHWQGK